MEKINNLKKKVNDNQLALDDLKKGIKRMRIRNALIAFFSAFIGAFLIGIFFK